MKDLFKRILKSSVTYVSIVASIVTIIAIKVDISIRIGWLVLLGLLLLVVIISSVQQIDEVEKNKAIIEKESLELEKNNQELGKKNMELENKVHEIETDISNALRMNANNYEKEGDKSIYYFDYNEYLPEDAVVSFYYSNKNGGKQICSGRVLNVEPHEYITVEIIPNTIVTGREDLFNEFQSSSPDIVKNVYIKLVVKEGQLRKIASQLWR